MITFFAIVAVILLSAFLGSTIAWVLAHTVLSVLERRRMAFGMRQPMTVAERLDSFRRSRALTS